MGNPKPIPKHLAVKLSAIRKHLGLSQIKMVMLLKNDGSMAYHRVSEFEKGRRSPDLMTVLAYARAAGIPMEYLADDDMDLETFKKKIARAENAEP